MSIAGSFLNKDGKASLLREIDKFFLLKSEDKKQKEDEKLPPTGSFEKITKYFGGRK